MKIAFQHASGESVRPVLVLFVFGQHLVHEVREEFLVGRGQRQGLFFFRILEDGQLSPGGVSFRRRVDAVGEQEIFRECQQGAADGGMSFFEMHLMGEGEKQMARLYLMADKVYPMPVGTFLNQEVCNVDGLSEN